MDICARKGCEKEYLKKTHNQKYCTDECCRVATNERIMEKYYEDRDRIKGAKRICSVCSQTKLSRYNKTNTCASCSQLSESNKANEVRSLLMSLDLTS